MNELKIIIEHDMPVEMRDGTILRCDVYRPDKEEAWPTLLLRLPYNKSDPRYHVMLDPVRMAKNGYAVIWQDCRGTGASEGEFRPFNEGEDGYDSVEWAASRPWSNGKVGMLGGSYHGSTQWAAAKEQPTHLEAIFPTMISPGLRELIYEGGTFQLHTALQWGLFMSLLRLPRMGLDREKMSQFMGKLIMASDNLDDEAGFLPLKDQPVLKETALAPFYFDWLEHPDHDDYWESTTWTSFEKTTVPVHLMTGWYDIFLRGTLACFQGMKENGGSERARNNIKLLIGPWAHSVDLSQQVGDIDFGLFAAGPTIDIVGLQLKWFDHWLKGSDHGLMGEAPIRIFVMGHNKWRDEKEWPLARTAYTRFYLHSDGRANGSGGNGALDTTPPGKEGHDLFLYDPRNPVPSIGGSVLSRTGRAGPFDQAGIEERSDILVYSTSPLDDDMEVTGPIEMILFAATSAPDTDFTAKLVDVWPDGRAYNLSEGVIRARYRSTERGQSLIEPEAVHEYRIDLGATSNVFQRGHRIRIEVSSSNFPRCDRNLNTGGSSGEDVEMIAATQTIFHDSERPSHIVLPVIPVK
jgi:putative CocE/NonD family hydrolase